MAFGSMLKLFEYPGMAFGSILKLLDYPGMYIVPNLIPWCLVLLVLRRVWYFGGGIVVKIDAGTHYYVTRYTRVGCPVALPQSACPT